MQGDKRIDKLMLPVLNAINRHVKDRDAKTDIYNRAYEAVMISMVVKTSTTGVKTPESIENTNPDYYKQELARRDEELALTEKKLCNIDRSARAEVARRDERIAELEAMINPASFDKYLVSRIKDPEVAEDYARARIEDKTNYEIIEKQADIITRLCAKHLHRALMKELE